MADAARIAYKPKLQTVKAIGPPPHSRILRYACLFIIVNRGRPEHSPNTCPFYPRPTCRGMSQAHTQYAQTDRLPHPQTHFHGGHLPPLHH